MDDKQLDEKLDIASKQAEQFFANFRFDRYKKIVQQQINQPLIPSKSSSCFDKKFKYFAAIACVFVLVIAIAGLSLFTRQNNDALDNIQNPAYQPIAATQEQNLDYLMNYLNVYDYAMGQENLYAVIYIPLDQTTMNTPDANIPVAAHIIPYYTSDNGNLMLFSNNVYMNTGEYIIFVGHPDGQRVKIFPINNRVEQNGSFDKLNYIVKFRALKPGKDTLILQSLDNKDIRKKVNVEVVPVE